MVPLRTEGLFNQLVEYTNDIHINLVRLPGNVNRGKDTLGGKTQAYVQEYLIIIHISCVTS